MLELLFEILGEFIIQMLGGVLLQLGFETLAAPFQRKANPWLAAAGNTLYGALVGGLSVWLIPGNLVPPAWRLANLVVAPLVAGSLLVLWSAWQARQRETALRYDRFLYGYLFAFALAAVRFEFAS